MQDANLYGQLLGLESPWNVARGALDARGQRVDVYLEHGKGLLWPCPVCKKKFPGYDHKEERVWRRLDTMQLQT
ncbi:MAG: hypothetical protein JRN32_00885 [Nitrososphaerota archaeon]|nr:hypothetical protein [Nitrososphaerota archaeon]MDG7039017.1 hypothetical protein [Nitrososphaerota archaeon]MDG7045357.1 hypothetical protein [Nitrososphaerota archaeon]